MGRKLTIGLLSVAVLVCIWGNPIGYMVYGTKRTHSLAATASPFEASPPNAERGVASPPDALLMEEEYYNHLGRAYYPDPPAPTISADAGHIYIEWYGISNQGRSSINELNMLSSDDGTTYKYGSGGGEGTSFFYGRWVSNGADINLYLDDDASYWIRYRDPSSPLTIGGDVPKINGKGLFEGADWEVCVYPSGEELPGCSGFSYCRYKLTIKNPKPSLKKIQVQWYNIKVKPENSKFWYFDVSGYSPIAHVHNWQIKSQTAATCTGNGNKVLSCNSCGTETNEAIPAIGHVWPGGYVTTANNGTHYKDCTRCGTRLETQYNPYMVVYHGNGHTEGETGLSSHIYGTAKTLTANGYRKLYHIFEGWTENADGNGTLYSDQQTVKNLTALYNGTVNLYAQWRRSSSLVTFKNWDDSVLDVQEVKLGGTVPAPALPPRPGYCFAGWDKELDNITDHTEITAQWVRANYVARFDGNGGTNASLTKPYEAELGTLPVSKRTGFTFVGWFTSQEGGERITEKTKMPLDGAVYYARWIRTKYTVKFDSNGGSNPWASLTMPYEAELGILPVSKRIGYTFVGWFTSWEGGERVTEKTTMPLDGAVYYARWKPKTYHLKFHTAVPEIADVKKVIFNDFVGELPMPKVEDFKFLGWFMKPWGIISEKIYAMEATPSNADLIEMDTIYRIATDSNAYAYYQLSFQKEENHINRRPGMDGKIGTSDDNIYYDGLDGVSGTRDDKKISPGEDGIYGTNDDSYIWDDESTGEEREIYPGQDGFFGTENDYYVNDIGNKVHPGEDNIFGTEDDIEDIPKRNSGGSGSFIVNIWDRILGPGVERIQTETPSENSNLEMKKEEVLKSGKEKNKAEKLDFVEKQQDSKVLEPTGSDMKELTDTEKAHCESVVVGETVGKERANLLAIYRRVTAVVGLLLFVLWLVLAVIKKNDDEEEN